MVSENFPVVLNSLLNNERYSTISASERSDKIKEDTAIKTPAAASPEIIENWLASFDAYSCNPKRDSNSFCACWLASLKLLPLFVTR